MLYRLSRAVDQDGRYLGCEECGGVLEEAKEAIPYARVKFVKK